MRFIKSYIYFLATALVIGLANLIHAEELPIKKHMKDARIINRHRASLYSELSRGRSLPLSYELITMENLAQIGTANIDLEGKIYLENGIGLFKDDIIDMSLTPEFSPTFKNNDSPVVRIKVETKALRKKWLDLIKKDDLKAIYDEAVDLVDHGTLKETNQNCLTRHFVESVARSLMNMEGHRLKAKDSGLPDPKKLLLSFLKLQIRSLGWAQSLDKRAFPIQKDNIPLFCQDVPAIPYK